MSAHIPLVSVLVPVRQAPPHVLRATLDSLRGLNHPAYEVVVAPTLGEAMERAYDATAVCVVVTPGEPVGPELLAALLDVRPRAPKVGRAAFEEACRAAARRPLGGLAGPRHC